MQMQFGDERLRIAGGSEIKLVAARRQEAYDAIADGFETAATLLGPGDMEYGRIIRCLHHARRKAHRPPLVLARSPRVDRLQEAG